jgi:ribosomal protection tetracycline resistance protein
VRQDDSRQEIFVSLYGEVQKEVVGATLKNDYDIDVVFRETTMVCVERPTGVGEDVELLPEARSPMTPFLATVGLRIEPAPLGSGVHFGLDVKVGSIPAHVYKTVDAFSEAMERTVQGTLRQGIYGWEVTDCTVTMTDCDYQAPPRRWPGTTASDYRLRHRGVRANTSLPPRDPVGHVRGDGLRNGAAALHCAVTGDARFVVHPGG